MKVIHKELAEKVHESIKRSTRCALYIIGDGQIVAESQRVFNKYKACALNKHCLDSTISISQRPVM